MLQIISIKAKFRKDDQKSDIRRVQYFQTRTRVLSDGLSPGLKKPWSSTPRSLQISNTLKCFNKVMINILQYLFAII
jgi:hypothetical protein